MTERPPLRGKFEPDIRGGLLTCAVILGFFLIPVGIGMGVEAHGLTAAVAASVVIAFGVVVMIVGSIQLRRRWRLQRES